MQLEVLTNQSQTKEVLIRFLGKWPISGVRLQKTPLLICGKIGLVCLIALHSVTQIETQKQRP